MNLNLFQAKLHVASVLRKPLWKTTVEPVHRGHVSTSDVVFMCASCRQTSQRWFSLLPFGKQH